VTAVRAQILAEIETRLKTIPGIAEVEIMPSGDPIDFPALHLFDDGHTITPAQAGVTGYDIAPELVGYVKGSSGKEAHLELTNLYVAAVALLMPDPPLGGLAETIDEGDMRVLVAPLEKGGRLAFTLNLPITFFTRRGDPAQAA
jgi:hypothetical protein